MNESDVGNGVAFCRRGEVQVLGFPFSGKLSRSDLGGARSQNHSKVCPCSVSNAGAPIAQCAHWALPPKGGSLSMGSALRVKKTARAANKK